MPAAPPRGVYTPVTTFFYEDESIDWKAFEQHILRLANGGIRGLVISGSNGESVHLSRTERAEAVRFARLTLDAHSFHHLPIIAGCGTHSARETIGYCQDAAEAGAEWALVLPPSYWVVAMTKPIIKQFFIAVSIVPISMWTCLGWLTTSGQVADKSPIPILLYNFPGVTSGIDLDSDLVIDLAQHANIVGMKFTCCNMGKLQRIAHNVKPEESFSAIVGKSEAFLPGLIAGSGGLIGALVNLVPKLHVKLLSEYDAGNLAEAQKLQALLSDADWALVKLGVAGLKTAIDKYYRYGRGRSRVPLAALSNEAWATADLARVEVVVRLENGLGYSKL
jgi:4-hydroxy-2-oxoglutarate aldolase